MGNPEESSANGVLGERLQVFKPMRATIVAGFFMGLLLVTVGLAAIIFPLREAYLAGGDRPFYAEKEERRAAGSPGSPPPPRSRIFPGFG